MIKRKLTAWITTAALVLTSGAPAVFADTPAPTFSDIKDHWAKSAIEEAVALKIVGGYPDGTFLPENLITREEFYILISNILTVKPDTSDTEILFKDVDPAEWYVPAIKTAVAGQMTSGYPDGTFGIGRMMTRQEAALVISAIIPAEVAEDSGNTAANAKDKSKIDDWAYDAVDLMFRKGYMKGDDKGNFKPTNAINRAEAVQLLLQVKKKETVIGKEGTAPITQPVESSTVALNDGCAKQHLPKTDDGIDTSEQALAALPEGVFTTGEGTESSPYQISTQEQLNHVREHNKEGIYFKLAKDVTITADLAEEQIKPGGQTADWRVGNWEPIGTKENPFVAVFDGNSHTISGLEIDNTGQEGSLPGTLKNDAAGMFSWVGEAGKIMDLRLSDMTVNNIGSYTGAIAGYMQGRLNGCSVESSVTVNGKLYTGGLLGYSEGGISSCTSYAIVNGSSSHVGGIVGYFLAKSKPVDDCNNRGNVTGTSGTGGIAGGVAISKDFTGNDAIKNSFNYGSVAGQSGNTGGIAGRVDGANGRLILNQCMNKGSIQGNAVVGGIAGYTDGSTVEIKSCENSGSIKGGSAGGIVGKNEGLVQLCFNTGLVDGSSDAGGIAGVQLEEGSKVMKCYNEGKIGYEKSTNNAGGIIGQNTVLVSHSYNSGKVYGTSNAGGIAGKNIGRILNVYNSAPIDGDSLRGSLAGRNQGSCTNGFWLVDTADASMGGSDSGAKLTQVIQVTENGLSGREKVRVSEGDYILDAFNSSAKIWAYIDGHDYPQLLEMQ